jgi:hypothetical protein
VAIVNDIIAEVVDGRLRRIADAADYVWPISEQEFIDAWLSYRS